MDLLDHVLRRMGRHATTLLPFSLLVGILFQDLAAAARPLVGPLATILLMLALVRTDWPRVRALLARPGARARAVGGDPDRRAARGLAALAAMLDLWPGLVAALCLSAMAPTVISAATTAAFLRLDVSLALLISLITNFAVPLTLPPLALWLLGLDLKIGAAALSLRLATIVRDRAGRRDRDPRLAEARAACATTRTRSTAVPSLVLIVFAIPLMDGIVARAMAEPVKLAGFVVGSFAGMLLCNAVMALGALPFLDRRTALTAGYCSSGRNNALLMAVLPVTADPDIFLFIAAVQVPIYVMPDPAAAALSPAVARRRHDHHPSP